MDDFSARLKSSLRYNLFFLAVFVVAWALLKDYRFYISGLILGTVAGAVNSGHLAWRIRKFADAAIAKQGRSGLGFAIRASVALLAVFAAQKLQVSTVAVVVGLFFVQLAILLLGILVKSRK